MIGLNFVYIRNTLDYCQQVQKSGPNVWVGWIIVASVHASGYGWQSLGGEHRALDTSGLPAVGALVLL